MGGKKNKKNQAKEDKKDQIPEPEEGKVAGETAVEPKQGKPVNIIISAETTKEETK